jgi:hypothetical protein
MDMFREFLSFLENEARCWDDAGTYCERCATNLPPEKIAELELICAVYREREDAPWSSGGHAEAGHVSVWV